MTSIDAGESIKTALSNYFYYGSLYSVVVGVLYLWGYWGYFDVNILEYMALTDVLKRTIFPVASACLFIALGAAIAEWNARNSKPRDGVEGSLSRGRRYARAAKWGIVAGIFVSSVDHSSVEVLWSVGGLILSFPLYRYFWRRGLLDGLISHEGFRSVIVFVLVIAPFYSFGKGRIEAADLSDGVRYRYVVSDTSDSSKAADVIDAKSRLRFIGQVDDYVFFLLPDNETLSVVGFDKVVGLKLRHFVGLRPSNLDRFKAFLGLSAAVPKQP